MGTNTNERLIRLGVAGAAGYYLLGKKPIGALAGIAVLMLLTKPKLSPPAGSSGMPIGAPEPSTGGMPAPGTTDDPLGGTVMPGGKSIGILR